MSVVEPLKASLPIWNGLDDKQKLQVLYEWCGHLAKKTKEQDAELKRLREELARR